MIREDDREKETREWLRLGQGEDKRESKRGLQEEETGVAERGGQR